MLSIYIARIKKRLIKKKAVKLLKSLQEIPEKIKQILNQTKEIKKIADKYCNINSILYLGQRYNFPIALEGALKLKETSRIHAEGLPIGELKHGTINLINKNIPCIFIFDKFSKEIRSNIRKVKNCNSKIIIITMGPCKMIKNKANEAIVIPLTTVELRPILTVIPLQLLAYYAGLAKL